MAALAYSRTLLLSITAKCCQIRLDNTLWRVLKALQELLRYVAVEPESLNRGP